MDNSKLTIALPSKGRLSKPTIEFLDKCSFSVVRENERQYQTEMKGLIENINVIFQRPHDIPKIVSEGKVDLGITGYDIFCESGGEMRSDNCISVFPDGNKQNPPLPYGHCMLVIAVPDHWVDILSISDLVYLSMARKKQGKMLRIATGFPHLTQNHLINHGLRYFEITEVYGAAESAPKMGSADFIVDLKSSGVTLTENRLKTIMNGEILTSAACLIASRSRLRGENKRLIMAKRFIDRIEAHLNAKNFWLITANIKGDSEDAIRKIFKGLTEDQSKILGQEGPTIATVLNLKDDLKKGGRFYSVTIQVESKYLDNVIDTLRNKTGRDILVSPISFVYDNKPGAYLIFENKLMKN